MHQYDVVFTDKCGVGAIIHSPVFLTLHLALHSAPVEYSTMSPLPLYTHTHTHTHTIIITLSSTDTHKRAGLQGRREYALHCRQVSSRI